MTLSNERIAYFNGQYLPESQVRIPFRDRSFLYGDGGFDMTRTFGHKLFKLQEHIERLYRTLKYLRLDPGLSPAEMTAITETVTERNLHLLDKSDDYWVGQRISRGVNKVEGDGLDYHGPNVIVECAPLPLKPRAKLFRDGIRVIVPSNRRVPPQSMTPRAKTHSYLNMVIGDQEVQAQDPGAWAILLDLNGNFAEGMGSNIFFVKNGEIVTPRAQFVLPGVSRQTGIDLAREEGIPVREGDTDPYDAYTADECFLTSTSLCICPVVSVNGAHIGPEGQVWGPITRRLADAYNRLVGTDFVKQYIDRIDDKIPTRAF